MLREVQKNGHSRVLLKLRKFFLTIIIIAVFPLIFYISCLTKEITVIGSSHYSDEQIKEFIVDSPLDRNAVLLYYKLKRGGISEIPFIQQIDVQLDGPNKITVNVFEKTVIGYIEYMGVNMYFDKDGVVIETTSEKLKGVPKVTGLQFDRVILHEPIKVQKEGMFEVVKNLTLLINKYELPIENVMFTYNNEVILVAGDIKAAMGKHDMYDDAVAELKNPLDKAIEEKLKGIFHMENFKVGQNKIIFEEKQIKA